MKKHVMIGLLTAMLTIDSDADTNKQPFVKGTFEINFRSRSEVDANGNPNPGVTDAYKLTLNVSDSAIFGGDIIHTPTIFSSLLGRESQAGKLDYKVTTSIVNPANPSNVKAVGRLTGIVPIDSKGVYRFNEGTLRIGVDASGRAAGFERKFTGTAAGRPPKSSSLLDKATKKAKEAIKITKEIKGKKVAVVVRDYDKMVFNGHVLAGGPVLIYPDAQVNGELLYDYERFAWYFQSVTIGYSLDGKAVTDKLTGNIRWVESPQRKTNGEGEYQFDVRVNEPEAKSTEADAFAPTSDEAAFFEADANIASLIGTMKYKDTLSGETVTRSTVTIDLQGNKLNRQQVMNLAKLLFISCVVPMNSE